MITKENVAYQALFQRANNVLNLDGDNVITNLDDYFMYLEDLRDAIQKGSNKEADNILLILPNDEELFTIDANSRKISVPSKFGSYGVGVKGDEVAEVLYFAIDRYFDIQDLFNKDIFVEWENSKGDTGLSVTINKTLLMVPGKVVFGWPIGSPINDAPGNLKFSVRFYERGQNSAGEPILTYSFSTLTSVVKINDGLNFEIADQDSITARIVDKTKLIFDNLKNSENMNVKIPALEPIFEMLYPEAAPLFSLPEKIDLVGGSQSLIAKTHFNDKDEYGAGTVKYTWYGTVKGKDGKMTDEIYLDTPIYRETEDTLKDPNDVYYVLNDVGEYVIYIGDFNTDKTLYEKYASFEATKAGSYKVSAINTYGKGNNSEEVFSDTCVIPFAEVPYFADYTDKNVIIGKDETLVAVTVEVADNGELTYQWKYNVDSDDFAGAMNIDVNSNEIDVARGNGYYYLVAANSKNNDTTVAHSDAIRVTGPAAALTANEILYLVDDVLVTKLKANVGQTIGVDTSPNVSNTSFDDFVFQWQFSEDEDVFTNIEGAIAPIYTPASSGFYRCVITTVYNGDTAEANADNFTVF